MAAQVIVGQDEITIELSGWNALPSLRRIIRIPLAAIRSIRTDQLPESESLSAIASVAGPLTGVRTGSVVLHEAYFGNLGGDGKAGAALRSRMAQSFGTFDAWETEFRKIGQGLGGGSGWVVLGLNRHLNILENYWMADHATGPVDTTPILVMDMYEHAYQMDYGAAAAKYIDAFFVNIQWDRVAARLDAGSVAGRTG